MDYESQNEPPILINPITVKESTFTAAPVANISNLIGWSKVPVK